MTTAASLHLKTSSGAAAQDSLAMWRLYLLRAGYLLIAAGMGSQMVPAFLHHGPWTLNQGVKNAMLLALAALSVLGIRYPLKMLPLLFWEMAWKTIWLAAIAFPLWRAGTMDAATAETAFAVGFEVIIFAVVPWDHVWRNFAAAKGARWR